MISRKTRPYRAGKQTASALCETAHILYLLDNRSQYLLGIKERIDEELSSLEPGNTKRLTGISLPNREALERASLDREAGS